MDTPGVLQHYQGIFPTAVNAYCFALLNRTHPHWFILDAKNGESEWTQTLERRLMEALFDTPQEFLRWLEGQGDNPPGSVGDQMPVETVKRAIENLHYLDVDWHAEAAWEHVAAEIEFTNLTPPLTHQDKQELTVRMQEIVRRHGIYSLRLNPNRNPEVWIDSLVTGIDSLARTLDFDPKCFGRDRLILSLSTEEGNFTGYSGRRGDQHLIVLKKLDVLAHEWMHFVENKQYSRLPSYLDIVDGGVEQKHAPYSDDEWVGRFHGDAVFLEQYAKQKGSFSQDVEILTRQFLQDGLSDRLIDGVRCLVKDSPERYFSFLRAETTLRARALNHKIASDDEFSAFAKIADRHLGLPYAATPVETFARTFEAYVETRSQAQNIICSLIHPCRGGLYPQGADRVRINKWWQQGWDMIKTASNLGSYPGVRVKPLSLAEVGQRVRKYAPESERKQKATLR